MEKSLDTLEKVWLDEGRKEFLVDGSDRVSVADLQIACELEQTKLAG